MAADDRIKRPTEKEDDIILLTEVVEEPPSEVVLELTPKEPELDSRFPRESASQDQPKAPAAADEDLHDFLASLKEEGLGAPAVPEGSPAAPVSQEPRLSRAELEEAVRREVASYLSEARLKAVVREVIQEKVENLSGELLTQVAREVMERKVTGLLKQLAAAQD